MNIYKHTLIGYVIIFAMIGGALALSVAPLPHQTRLLMVFPSVILILAAVLFCSLTIELNDTKLKWRFGPGLIHKSVAISDIEAVEAFRKRTGQSRSAVFNEAVNALLAQHQVDDRDRRYVEAYLRQPARQDEAAAVASAVVATWEPWE